MAGICCGVVGETESSTTIEASARSSRRRRLDLLPLKYSLAIQPSTAENCRKRQKIDLYRSTSSVPQNAVESSEVKPKAGIDESWPNAAVRFADDDTVLPRGDEFKAVHVDNEPAQAAVVCEHPLFGMTSVCGRRRDMEDAVSIQPSFLKKDGSESNGAHFYGVFDGHGCSHVALKCKDRLHEIVKQEIENEGDSIQWKSAMERSFAKMDEEVQQGNQVAQGSNCRCELQTPQCDAVGSTAVVAVVMPEKIVVSNCGDSRAVLCRGAAAVPLSSDHKPDRPDELVRIESAGGRVIYWDGARVLGVLAMSRAIGDNYLKPYVISEPEVTVMDRTAEDECLILASDGLWDVVSNDTACGVVRMCLRAAAAAAAKSESTSGGDAAAISQKACSDASILLTKLALARQSSDNVSVVVVDLRRPGRS